MCVVGVFAGAGVSRQASTEIAGGSCSGGCELGPEVVPEIVLEM